MVLPDGSVVPQGGQPPGQPGPGGQPGGKPDQPATTQAVIIVPATTRPADGAAGAITLNFKEATADSVLEYLAEATGYTLIKEGQIDGRVTIQTRRPVPPAEAVRLINTVLRIEGYALILQGTELRVMQRGKAKKSDIPVHVGANPDEVPLSDDLITQIIPLGKTDAGHLKGELQPLLGPDADFTVSRDNNALVITDTARNIRRVVQIVAELDKQGSTSSDMRIIHLKRSDPTTTAKMLQQIFKPSGNDQFSRQMMMMMQQQGMGGDSLQQALRGGRDLVAVPDDRTGTLIVTGPSDSLKIVDKIIEALEANETVTAEVRIFTLKYADADNAAKLVVDMFKSEDRDPFGGFRIFFFGGNPSENTKQTKVTAVADYRTGTLVVTAPPVQMKIIAEVIEKLDSNPIGESAFFIYRLKNAQAAKLAVVLNTAFGVGPEAGQNQNQQQQLDQNGQPIQNGQNRGGGGRNGFGNNNNNNGGNGNIGGFRTSGGRRAGYGSGRNSGIPQLNNQQNHLIGEMAGEVFMVADVDTNALLVTTATKYRDKVKDIIDELDRPVPQVLIKVLIAEVTHDNSEDLGTDFSVLYKRDNGKGTSVGSTLGAAASAAVTGGLVVSVVESNVNVTLHALAQAGKLDVLSRPYILASDNQLATIMVGQEVPLIFDSRTTDQGNTINSIRYDDVGIILNVTPHINENGLVILDVTPEISQLTTSTVPISSTVSAPIINRRSADSRVGILDGQTIVIGGLMEDRKVANLTKVPILGDIPVIGPYLFQRNQTTKTKTELLIFLTPHVAQQAETLKPMSDDEVKGTRLTPTAIEPGTFDEQMKGMKRGSTESRSSVPSTQPARP
jgi:general secretion pathway protein D